MSMVSAMPIFFLDIDMIESSDSLGNERQISVIGRRPWTTRLTVEDSFALDIGQLVRAGVFDAEPGILCSHSWNDGLGNALRRVTFRVMPDRTGALAVHFYHPVPAELGSPARIQQQIVQMTTTNCNFGGMRRWFRCSLVKNGYPCGTRAQILYATPHEILFGCRKCHDLTYESAQKHDKRIDWLLKLPMEEFNQALATGTIRQRLLAVSASTVRLQRIQKKVAKMYKRLPRAGIHHARPNANVTANSGQNAAG
jgi:hypothetical protein